LDQIAGVHGSRAVFITYVVGLYVCYGVYALSNGAVANKAYVSEEDLLRKESELPSDTRDSSDREEAGRESNAIPIRALANTNRDCSLHRRTRQVSQERQSPPNNLSRDELARRELLEIFQEAAKLREASAKVDQRIARLLESLGDNVIA
jgi:hypothetical protein